MVAQPDERLANRVFCGDLIKQTQSACQSDLLTYVNAPEHSDCHNYNRNRFENKNNLNQSKRISYSNGHSGRKQFAWFPLKNFGQI